MNLEKCDKCGNRNIMCFLCENNKHYRETKYSHNNSIRNNAIDEFAERLKVKAEEILKNPDVVSECKKCTIWSVRDIDEIAEKLEGGAE